jgi:hypothetical protein
VLMRPLTAQLTGPYIPAFACQVISKAHCKGSKHGRDVTKQLQQPRGLLLLQQENMQHSQLESLLAWPQPAGRRRNPSAMLCSRLLQLFNALCCAMLCCAHRLG